MHTLITVVCTRTIQPEHDKRHRLNFRNHLEQACFGFALRVTKCYICFGRQKTHDTGVYHNLRVPYRDVLMLVCNQFVAGLHLQGPYILLHDTQAHMSVFFPSIWLCFKPSRHLVYK